MPDGLAWIAGRLERESDAEYRVFTARLLPTVAPSTILGVRLPALRKLAGEIRSQGQRDAFQAVLPHATLEENLLHAILLSDERDYGTCLAGVESFLPYVDNWSVCDALRPRSFAAQPEDVLEHVRIWIRSDRPYTVRFGVGVLMRDYLDRTFDPAQLALAAGIRSEDYYVQMGQAWYFATALAKQWDSTVPYLQPGCLSEPVRKKAVRKAQESFRISPEQKAYLRRLPACE